MEVTSLRDDAERADAATPRRRRAAVGFTRAAGLLGVVGVATAIAAVLGTQDVDAWIVGLVASGVTLVLTAILLRIVRP